MVIIIEVEINSCLSRVIQQPSVIPEDSPIKDFEDKRYRESILSSYFDVLSIDSTVAISHLSFEELEYFDEKKEDKKEEVDDEGRKEDSLKNSVEGEK